MNLRRFISWWRHIRSLGVSFCCATSDQMLPLKSKHTEKRPECMILTRINVSHRYIEHGGSGPELEAW